MQRIIQEYLEHAELISNTNQLRDAVARVIRPFDFSAFAFLALSDKGEAPFLVSSYDAAMAQTVSHIASSRR